MRLIDADELSDNIQDKYHGFYSEIQIAPYQIDRMIDDMPTVDAKPVIHAHWIEFRANNGNVHYKCSHCGVSYSYAKNRWKYCIECGARMDEEK